MNIVDEPLFDAEFEKKEIQNPPNPDLAERIQKLVKRQAFCILCTQGQNQPYGSLIAYAFTADLKHFFFTTSVATRKFKLLSECPQVALVIDSRSQQQEDLSRVEALTITGTALQIQSGTDHEFGLKLLKSRHPYLADFLASPTTALFRVDVLRYLHVTRFQEVSYWVP